jgi:type II secretory pathway pseudopilin PulG
MVGMRPWHLAVLIVVLMILGGLIGSVLWSTSRNNRKQ